MASNGLLSNRWVSDRWFSNRGYINFHVRWVIWSIVVNNFTQVSVNSKFHWKHWMKVCSMCAHLTMTVNIFFLWTAVQYYSLEMPVKHVLCWYLSQPSHRSASCHGQTCIQKIHRFFDTIAWAMLTCKQNNHNVTMTEQSNMTRRLDIQGFTKG